MRIRSLATLPGKKCFFYQNHGSSAANESLSRGPTKRAPPEPNKKAVFEQSTFRRTSPSSPEMKVLAFAESAVKTNAEQKKGLFELASLALFCGVLYKEFQDYLTILANYPRPPASIFIRRENGRSVAYYM
jgi:hypothetical protein